MVGLHNLYNFVNLVAASSMFDICWRTRRMRPALQKAGKEDSAGIGLRLEEGEGVSDEG